MKIISHIVTSSKFVGPALSPTWGKETKQQTKFAGVIFLSRGETVSVVDCFNLVRSELRAAEMSGFEHNIEKLLFTARLFRILIFIL